MFHYFFELVRFEYNEKTMDYQVGIIQINPNLVGISKKIK